MTTLSSHDDEIETRTRARPFSSITTEQPLSKTQQLRVPQYAFVQNAQPAGMFVAPPTETLNLDESSIQVAQVKPEPSQEITQPVI